VLEASLLAQVFPEQVTTNSLAQNIVYATGTVGALSILAGLLMVDLGGVRRVNVFDALIQKVIGFFIGFVVYFLIGFAIWNWQYYVAFGVEDPYIQAIKDWWLGGSLTGALAQTTDPAVAAGLNTQQLFIFFLACFAGIVNVLLHLALTERIKASAFYIISAVTAVVSSALSWATYGSTGPLTNLGYHDFFGSGFVYLLPGAMALVLSRMVGNRPGMYRPHPRIGDFRSYNLGITVTGVILVFAGLPMVVLSCGFFFEPEALFVGINMSDTSIGTAFNNLGLAWAGGALTGAVIAYRTKNYIYTLLGPFAGYVSGAPGFDIYAPWEMLLVAMFAPVVSYVIYEWTQRKEIDEHKLINLFVGVGSYGLLMVGILNWGTGTGGYFGLDSGDYAFQHAEINLGWQVLGVVVCLGVGAITAWILGTVLQRTTGLVEDEPTQVAGLDVAQWDIVHDMPSEPATNGALSEPAAVAAGRDNGTETSGSTVV
jgi:ammonium transporter, Amt family